MKNITALIMTRRGSKRVVNKNTRVFGKPEMSLLIHKIQQLQEVEGIERIVLNSDCHKSLNIAEDMGIGWTERDDKYAQDDTEPSELYQHVAQSSCLYDSDYILSASVCYPFISSGTYQFMVNRYKQNNIETLVGGSPMHHHLLMSDINGLGYTPLNYVAGKQPNSQELTDIFSVCFGGIITTKDVMMSGDLVGRNPHIYELTQKESIDIDTEFDWSFAEHSYKQDLVKNKCCGGKCRGKGGCKI
jgi:CMP-N-acetylneuraminic acid synthetase